MKKLQRAAKEQAAIIVDLIEQLASDESIDDVARLDAYTLIALRMRDLIKNELQKRKTR